MIYLDTHVTLWLYEKILSKFSQSALKLIEENELLISGMVFVELQFLYEIKRINLPSHEIITELKRTLGLQICELSLNDIAEKACKLSWTRDPFDRIIVANAMLNNKPLVTKDKNIHKHCNLAAW